MLGFFGVMDPGVRGDLSSQSVSMMLPSVSGSVWSVPGSVGLLGLGFTSGSVIPLPCTKVLVLLSCALNHAKTPPTARMQQSASATTRPVLFLPVCFESMVSILSAFGFLLCAKAYGAPCHLMCFGAGVSDTRLSGVRMLSSSSTMLTPITTATPAMTMKTPGGCVTNALT